MKIISIISQKGGSGKSTISVHLAVAGILSKKSVVLIDLDPQGSAVNWGDSRKSDRPVVTASPINRLSKVLEAGSDADLIILDTQPHTEVSALVAARASDLILVPCRPSILDIRAIGQTIDLARIAGKPMAIVFNATPPRGTVLKEAIGAVQSYGDITVCPIALGHRAIYSTSLTAGLTCLEYDIKSKASLEVLQLYKWISKLLKL